MTRFAWPVFGGGRKSASGPPSGATVPAAFTAGQWSTATGLEPFQIVVNITALPNDGGSAIAELQYDAGAGWTALTGTGAGPRILTMPEAGAEYSVQIRAVNAVGAGAASAAKSATSGAEAVAPLSRLAVHVDADIDTVGERDDIAAMALWLGNQDDFNLLGFTCSPPDGNHQEYINCINAYETDRPTIIAKPGINSADFKTGAELLALVQDGANADAPARGYRLVGESQYTNAHAAAQLLIANARDHGDPTSTDPTRKLWVAVQGGYVTLAQALYEACDPAGPMELPDILDRIRVVGQPNWNSSQAPNSWNYIFGNAWPADGVPGMFGDLWMICGYLQWHAFNRDNGTTDTTFWNDITERSAFGQHLRNTLTRAGGTYKTPHFRAGDAGIWFWLKSAKDLGNFDPENPANLCGSYRTYEGVNPWPSQTVGYGAGSGLGTVPNPEGVTWSPTIWAPELTVNSFEASYGAVDLAAWYSMVADYMERYQQVLAPAQVATPAITGTVLSWTAPEDNGSPITDYIITNNGEVVADGVGTATSYDFGVLPDGNYSATVAAVNAIGTGPASSPRAFTVGGAAPAILAYQLNEGSGATITNGEGETGDIIGATWATTPTRLNFDGVNDRLETPPPSGANEGSDFIVGIVARFNALTGDPVLVSRNGLGSLTDRVFTLRVQTSNGQLQYLPYNAGTTTPISAGSVAANEWGLFLIHARQEAVTVRKNGITVVDTTHAALNAGAGVDAAGFQWGCRYNPSTSAAGYRDFFNGSMAAARRVHNATAADIAAVEAELRAIATSKGITLP